MLESLVEILESELTKENWLMLSMLLEHRHATRTRGSPKLHWA
jgi:hypothetical protein